MRNLPEHKFINCRVNKEAFRLFKVALSDLDMTASEFMTHSIKLHHQIKLQETTNTQGN
jgi:hypothetical protein